MTKKKDTTGNENQPVYAIICLITGLMDGWYNNKQVAEMLVKSHRKDYPKKFLHPVILEATEQINSAIPDGMFHVNNECVMPNLYVDLFKVAVIGEAIKQNYPELFVKDRELCSQRHRNSSTRIRCYSPTGPLLYKDAFIEKVRSGDFVFPAPKLKNG